jgi:formylglycine-generating enzyme required for sulfatase activity
MNGDAAVDGADLGTLLSNWGGVEGQGDINGDGVVDGADLGILLTSWGSCIIVPSWATLIEAQPDPAVVWDADLRAAISATGFAWRVKDTATQIELLLIPPGEFLMGCSGSQRYSCGSSENPVHTVTLPNAFYLGRYEVTQAQWEARMGSNPSYFQSATTQVPPAQIPERPVEQVSWNQIAGPGGFMAQTGLRLPTEAEWEYAYRAGTTRAFHGFTGFPDGTNDDSQVENIAWYSSVSNIQTRPVGGKLGNGFGLHDMAGNVWEWVNDWYGSYSAGTQTNPIGPTNGSYRVIRGGAWKDIPPELTASNRNGSTPDNTVNYLGCRAAKFPYAPSVTAVSPTTGPTAGGTVITLTGTNLTGATGVTVGGVAAGSVQVIDATTVTAVTPPGSVGAKAVAVTTPSGTAWLAGAFTYATGVVPSWATLLEVHPDPKVVTDSTIRAAIVDSGSAWRVLDSATQIEFVLIPPGTFQMGCSPSNLSNCASAESPARTVTLTNPLYVGRFEVTQGQWANIMGSNPSFFTSATAEVPPELVLDRPVETVTWNMVAGPGGFLSQVGMRLPTEAEWEYAYRAGTTTAYHGFNGAQGGTNEEQLVGNIAWFREGGCDVGSRCQTRPVGLKAANGFGLHDMSGNVWEWVSDWYGSYQSAGSSNPTGPTSGWYKVVRGGNWDMPASACRSSARSYLVAPIHTGNGIGFRAVRVP